MASLSPPPRTARRTEADQPDQQRPKRVAIAATLRRPPVPPQQLSQRIDRDHFGTRQSSLGKESFSLDVLT